MTLGKVAYPILWVAVQWLIVLLMSEFGMRHAAIGVVSSLLTAWIVISIVTVFITNPLWSTIIAVSAWIVAALSILGWLDRAVALLDSASFSLGQLNISALIVVKGTIALGVLLWITAIAGQVIEGRIQSSANLTPSIQVLATKLMHIGLAVIAFVFALSIVGIDLTAFAVLGGAIGVGLGFGLQKIFANLVSGFILLLDKSIKPGDVIAIADDYGRVDSLGARYVSVLTRDGIEHLIPNEELITTRVENWSYSNDLLRLRKTIGIHYKSDVRKAIELCLQAADEIPRILKDPMPVCYVQDFADSSVNLEVRFWINDPVNGRANVIGPLLLGIWDKFHEHGIEIPYPQRDLHLRSSNLPSADGAILPGSPSASEAAA
ncbi:MAG: mechanosensitive ion channel [Rhodothermales bacterium]|nr:mechanosensitive ion channel [Rhodothermales bacterium]